MGTIEKATFAAGCFWGVEEAFRQVKGVISSRVGYLGGKADKPTYEQVCAGGTGHSEVVEVEYDSSRVSYDDLIHVFWNVHDPTYPAKTQYKSAIFFHSPEQERVARSSLERVKSQSFFQRNVLTEILPAGEFFPAEEYHQQYLRKNR